MIKYALSVILILNVFLTFGQQKEDNTIKVLFIGNSYTYYNDLPKLLTEMANSTGDKLIADNSTFGGLSLKQHLSKLKTLTKIKNGLSSTLDSNVKFRWDYVVLQEQSILPLKTIRQVEQEVFPYAKRLDSLIHVNNPKAKTVFYRTWGRKNGDKARCTAREAVCTYLGMDSLLAVRYQTMAESNKAILSPVGEVWKVIRQKYPDVELYNIDWSHPSKIGSYVAATCFYAILLKKNPKNIKFDYDLDPALATKINVIVKEVVFDQLPKWYGKVDLK